MRKMWKRMIATLLVIAMFTAELPAQAMITDLGIEDELFLGEENNNMILSEEAVSKETVVVGEDESRRDANTKHFILSDGSRSAVMYSEPVHYEEDGKWKDIDNTLVYEEITGTYENKENDFTARFDENPESDKLLSLEKDGYTISWEYVEKNSGHDVMSVEDTLQATDSVLEKTKPARKFALKGERKETRDEAGKPIRSAGEPLRYEDMDTSCDLEYIVTGNGVKENIILSEPTGQNTFTFEVTATGLSLVKNKDGSISAQTEDGEKIFHIPAPFMYDDAGVYSDAVEYTLHKEERKGYRLIVTADKEWLTAKERVYPVIIDPVITTEQERSSISCTFVASDSDYENTNFNQYSMLCVGWDTSSYEKTRTLVKFDLPELNKGDMVVGAYLNMFIYGGSFYATGMEKQQFNVHRITESWDASEVTWETQPSFEGIVSDYGFFRPSGNNVINEWTNLDVTKIVKGWYESKTESEKNHGLLLKKEIESGTAGTDAAYAMLWSDKYNNLNDAYPMIQINYRNNKGLEGYWNYTSVSAGAAGKAHINDYSGNLVFEVPLASTAGERLTASLNLYYNGYCANEKYVTGKNGSSETVVGRGFRLNMQQTLLPSTLYGLDEAKAEEWPYVYTDGDGTEHYFKKLTEDKEIDDNLYQYRDEDGLGLYLTANSSYEGKYEITDGAGNSWYFNSEGNLCCLSDNNLNEINISYTNGNKKQISKIKDANGHYFLFEYRETEEGKDDFVKTIKDDANRVTTFYYDQGCLVRIQYSDGTKSYFTYVETTNDLKTASDNEKVGLTFAYKKVSGTKRVKQVREIVNADTEDPIYGQRITFDRSEYNTTIKRTSGVDGLHGEFQTDNAADDMITTYQFDNMGRTTSTQVKYGNGVDGGAGVAGYTSTDTDKTASPQKNKISSQAGLGSNVQNLVKDSNASTLPDIWTYSATGSVIKSVDDVTTEKYMGRKSFQIHNSSMSTASNTYIRQQCTNFMAGATYTFSAYVKTKEVTKAIEDSLIGANLQIGCYDTNNTGLLHAHSKTLQGTTDTSINGGWRRLTLTFTVPANTTTLYLYLCLRNATGYAWFDCMQLEAGSVANDYNMLENSSFEQSSSGTPTGWSKYVDGNNTWSGTNGVSGSNKKNGNYSVRIDGEAKVPKRYYQEIPVEGNPNDTYILSGWAKADAVTDIFNENRNFELGVRVTYSVSDGTTINQWKDPAVFNKSVSGWQYSSVPIVLAYKDGESGKTYTPTKIYICCRYDRQENTAYFDHIQLIKDVASSYQYDSKGNVISVAANAEQKENMEYSGKDLTKYIDPEGNKYVYEYDAMHNLTTVTLPGKSHTEYIYDDFYGKVEAQEMWNKSGTTAIRTENGYSAKSGHIEEYAYLTSTKDAYGNVTHYEYNNASGLQTAVVAANGAKTEYDYGTDYGRLQQVKNAISAVDYTYSGNLLTGITFSDLSNSEYNENYSFVHDVYGNVLQTKVGNVALTTNTYGSKNGLLQNCEYGNGDGIKYVYDKMGNISMIYQKHDANTDFDQYSSYFWQYATDGTPLVHQDGKNQLRYEYQYDSIGRLIRQNMTKTTDSSMMGYTEFGYDNRNNLAKTTNAIGTETLAQNYTYNADGLAEKYTTSKGQAVLYTYDGLNRLTKRDLYYSLAQSPVIETTYTYFASKQGTGYTTTNLKTETIKGTEYKYTYDYLWNMKSILKAGVGYRSYDYDTYGQLTRENNASTGESTKWTYDKLGNIETATKYAYSTDASLQNETEVVTYNYGADTDAGWNKLLKGITTTTYNEDNTTSTVTETIDYDAIGNPISYRGATMGWYGRQMTSYSKDGISITNTYDADGIRGSKTVNGSKTTYQYVSGKLYYEKRGDGRELYYLYDSYGNLALIRMYYGNSVSAYYVATNSQGDVIGLYTNTGVQVASYEYDAWGNTRIYKPGTNGVPVDITDSTEEHIGLINPIRYRGYYYDADMGLYYLMSRYYDASIGRFINADGYVSTGQGFLGHNMFAYCGNNPVMRMDMSGTMWAVSMLVCMLTVVSYVKKIIFETSDYDDFLDALGMRESSDNYLAENQYGYLGRYQMGDLALQDAGFMDSNNSWTSLANGYGVYSKQDFLGNPSAQDYAITAYHSKVVGYIKYYGMDAYVGTEYCGVQVTKSGLLAACHLVGVTDMKNALSSGIIVWDGNGVEASEYLRMFEGYDISKVW